MRAFYRSIAALSLSGAALSVATANAAPLATNLPGVTVNMDVPANLNPLTASPQQLEAAGLPPRPDAQLQAKAFASWKRAVTSNARHVMPSLVQTDIKHGPHKPQAGSNGTSYNWSGYALVNSQTSLTAASFYFLVADYVVPVAEQAFGACTGGWDWSSSWVGIDGYGSSDVLQAGTEQDAYCSGSTKSAYYAAWYEWYPLGEVRIGNFPVSPGDDMFVEVWSTNSTTGHAYLVNYNTNQVVNITFSAPSGTTLVGNSAEWVVERPSVGGSLATLTNYIQDFFEDAYAYDFNYHSSSPSYPYSGNSSVPLTMLDNSGNGISYPSLIGPAAILFNDEGSAR
jgi:hypothetical protein